MSTALQTLRLNLVVPDHLTINLMPPVPKKLTAHLHITALLKNESQNSVKVTAPTPCDVTYWIVKDSDGKTVDTSRPKICDFLMQSREIAAGDTLRHDDDIELNAHALVPNEDYTVEYHFWGIEAKASFNVLIAV